MACVTQLRVFAFEKIDEIRHRSLQAVNLKPAELHDLGTARLPDQATTPTLPSKRGARSPSA
jgi:hypothetical protein